MLRKYKKNNIFYIKIRIGNNSQNKNRNKAKNRITILYKSILKYSQEHLLGNF
jgi:hypothetical protein